MKKLMLLVAVFMLGSTGIAFAQEPVKKDKPATEQTENKQEEAKEEVKEEPKQEASDKKEETKTEKPATEEKTGDIPAQPAQ